MGEDSERGPARGFEPPPWEIDQFEELARRRAAEAAAAAQRTDGGTDTPAAQAESAPEAESAEGDGEAEASGRDPSAAAAGENDGPGIDVRMADAMLVQLSGEEGSALKPAMRASRVVAVVLAAVGAGMVVVGGVTAARVAAWGAVGALGAGTIVVFGGFIFGVSVWLWVRASGQGS